MIINYYKIKVKRNLSYIANIGLYTQISIILSAGVYLFLYSLINTIVYGALDKNKFVEGLSIAANIIYCLTSLLLMTYYKDIIFAMTFVGIEVGFISKSSLLGEGELITAIVVLSLISIGIVTSIFQFGKLTFGYEEDGHPDNLLENNKIKHRVSHRLSEDL